LGKVCWKAAPVRVKAPFIAQEIPVVRYVLEESSCLGLQLKVGGKFHLKLNIGKRPIVKKYREGTMKRTLKRGLKLPEIVKREEFAISVPVILIFYVFIKYGCNFNFMGICAGLVWVKCLVRR
jgi:hypothetical protein